MEVLYGKNLSERLDFLRKRIPWTIVIYDISIVVFLASRFFKLSILPDICLYVVFLTMMFLWGWSAMENITGIHPFKIMFEGNLITFLLLFTLYTMGALIAGIISSIVGRIYFYYLLVKVK